MAMRYRTFFTFLITSSHARPVPNSNIPAVAKSIGDQFTPVENCIAINGTSNINTTVIKIPVSRLFCVFILILFLFENLFVCLPVNGLRIPNQKAVYRSTLIRAMIGFKGNKKYFVLQSKLGLFFFFTTLIWLMLNENMPVISQKDNCYLRIF